MKLKTSILIGVMVLSMIAMVPKSHGSIIWADEIIASSNVSNQNYALGSPDSMFASINGPMGYITFGFGMDFLDLNGSDIVFIDAVPDSISLMNKEIGDLYVISARRVADSGWTGLTWDFSLGGWQLLEIPGMYAGAYDQIRLTSIYGAGNGTLEIDTIGVKNPVTSVPEPSTLLLLGSGLVGVAAFGRKKFKK